MVQTLGSATTGYAAPATSVDLPRPTGGVRPAHQPWCVDCKRKHDQADLDTDGRCARCAKAAVSRAAAAARREAQAAELAALEAKHLAAAQADARKKARPVPASLPRAERKPATAQTSTTSTGLPTEGKQGQPTTRSSAPRATSTSSTTGRAPVAGSSTTQEKPSAAAPAGHAPRQAAAEAPDTRNVDAQIDHASRLLRATSASTHPVVTYARTAAIAALEALHIAHELHQTPAAATSTPAAAGPATATPSPAAVAPRTSAAGTGKGKPAPAADTRRTRRPSIELDEQSIVDAYTAGQTAPSIAKQHGVLAKRIRAVLARHGVTLRDDRVGHSGGRNALVLPDNVVARVVRRYVEDHDSIADIATDLGHHRRIITKALVDAGVTIRPPAHLGQTKLTDEQVADAVRRYTSGETLRDIALHHHVGASTIRAAVASAGLPIRVKGASSSNADRMKQLGVTAAELRAWATANGIDVPPVGLIPGRAIDAYAAAHQPSTTSSTTTTTTGDTAA